jgi:hypothetical protein
MRRKMLVGSTVVAVTAFAAMAGAAEIDTGESYLNQHEAAPKNAFELTAGANYTQGFGQINAGAANNINDVANAGIGFNLGVGYRVSPAVSVGVNGEYQEFSTSNTIDPGSSSRGMAYDVNVQYHFNPYRRMDPWVKFGTGYRFLWQVPSNANATTVMFHGFDFGKLQAGLDIRSAPGVAFGPMIGADLNVFFWERPNGGSNTNVTDPRVNTFIYAGLQGRFDMGGVAVHEGEANEMTAMAAKAF